MEGTASQRSPLVSIGIALGGILVALLMLSGAFNFLNAHGVPTGLISFLIVLVGVFSLAKASRTNFLPSVVLVFIGLFLFADSLDLLGSGQMPWLWPVFIICFALLLLVYTTMRKPA